ncbi:MAG: hypothetical protein U0Y10_20440 [Spirosomataceae bacterium]
MQEAFEFRHFWNFVRWQFYENPWFYILSWVAIFLIQLANYQTIYIELTPFMMIIQVILVVSYTSFILRHFTTAGQTIRYLVLPVSVETKFLAECLYHSVFFVIGWLGYKLGLILGLKPSIQFYSSPLNLIQFYLLFVTLCSLTYKSFRKNALLKTIIMLIVFFLIEAYLTPLFISIQLTDSWVKSIRLYDSNAVVNLGRNLSNVHLYLTDVSINFVNEATLAWAIIGLLVVASYLKTKEKTI